MIASAPRRRLPLPPPGRPQLRASSGRIARSLDGPRRGHARRPELSIGSPSVAWVRQPIVRHCSCIARSPRRPRIRPIRGSSQRQPIQHVGSDVGSNAVCSRISKLEHLVRAMFCAPGRNRTYDRQIRRLLLYPLSYGGRERAVRAPYGRLGHHCSAGSIRLASSYAMNTTCDQKLIIIAELRPGSMVKGVRTGGNLAVTCHSLTKNPHWPEI